MKIEIDLCPPPKKSYFISVSLNDKEAISFDNTLKGHRIVKQVLVENKEFPIGTKPTAEWDTIILDNGKFEKTYHVKWKDMGKKDWVNDEVWEAVWQKPISKELSGKLLHFSRLISDNYLNLDKYTPEVKEFEILLENTMRHLEI
ncbi:MAG: hypothetical protein NTW79_01720 [Candidatus Berkelbacteria bacterium]|nr:hypothetical protein [Candidatus Berkelbacteria bacterium]